MIAGEVSQAIMGTKYISIYYICSKTPTGTNNLGLVRIKIPNKDVYRIEMSTVHATIKLVGVYLPCRVQF